MLLEKIQHHKNYEYNNGKKVVPIYVLDILPTGVLCKNLDTKRELFVKKQNLSKIQGIIENMSEWRLRNGD